MDDQQCERATSIKKVDHSSDKQLQETALGEGFYTAKAASQIYGFMRKIMRGKLDHPVS
jgi:hypothetical protein